MNSPRTMPRPARLRSESVASARSGRMPHGPHAERQAEAVFLLGDDLVGQEAAQRLLEEPAQLQALELVVRLGSLSEKASRSSSSNGKPTSMPAKLAALRTFGRSLSASV